jgi:H+/Cl- antiporter ClcA
MSRSLTRLPRPTINRLRLSGASVLVGIVAGLAATGLEFGLHFGSQHLIGRIAAPGEANALFFDLRLLLLPTAGCLIAGLWVQILDPHPQARTCCARSEQRLVAIVWRD